jgi:hypothetical protein
MKDSKGTMYSVDKVYHCAVRFLTKGRAFGHDRTADGRVLRLHGRGQLDLPGRQPRITELPRPDLVTGDPITDARSLECRPA